MKTPKQLVFPGFEKLLAKDFGGSLLRGNAREQRPISIKRAMHIVLRSSLATGNRSFLKPGRANRIRYLVYRTAKTKGVKIYRMANSGNHLHIIVLPRSRAAFIAFIRAISGLIARLSLGVERGRALGLKFWDARPFSRVLEWGKDYRQACQYLVKNTLEALGFIPHQPRHHKMAPMPITRRRKTGPPH